jgi:arsenite methyltransferase
VVAVLGYTKEEIAAAVKEMYTVVATEPLRPLHFPVGAEACRAVGYPEELLVGIPAEALASFAGVGCPFHGHLEKPLVDEGWT